MYKSAQEEIKDVINSTFKPILKELGYRKKGNTWNLCKGEFIKVINVQSSSGNSFEKAKFTINLGIYNSNFQKEKIHSGKSDEKNIKEYDCEIRGRLGTISVGYDFWWTVLAGKNNEKVLQDLKLKFVDYGLKWLDSFNNLEDEYYYFVKNNNYASALITAYLLNKDTVLECFQQTRKDANPYYAGTLERWMSKRNLAF